MEALLLPPGSLLLVIATGAWIGNRAGRGMIFAALAVFYLISTPYVASRLLQGLQTHPALSPEQARSSASQAIIVLGGGRYPNAPEYGGDTLGHELLERVRYAAWLHHRSGIPIIPSGGGEDDEIAEAVLMREVLEQEYAAEVLAIEAASRTTRENALLTKHLLESHGVGRVLLVTHSWHMPRALRSFRTAGVDAVPAPTIFSTLPEHGLRDWLPSAQAAAGSSVALHELLGMLWYRFRN